MVNKLDISDFDMKRPPIKTFQDGTEIRFILGTGLKDKNGKDKEPDFYYTVYSRNKKAIALNDSEIFEYCRRLIKFDNTNTISNLVYVIKKLFKHDMDKIRDLTGFDMRRLAKDIQYKEIMLLQDKEVMVNIPILKENSIANEFLKYDSQFIKGISSSIEKKIDNIIDISDIKSIYCTAEKKDINLHDINKKNIIDKLFGELGFCHEKFLCYLYTVFLSEDIYIGTVFERKIKMAGILCALEHWDWDTERIAKYFKGDSLGEKIDSILLKYDDEQKNIHDSWEK